MLGKYINVFLTKVFVHILHWEGGDQSEALLQLTLQQPGEEVEADQLPIVHNGSL